VKRGCKKYWGENAYFKKGKQQTIEKIKCRTCMEKTNFFKKDFIWRSRGIRKEKGIILLETCTSVRFGKEN
jgi:hypothetical protein